MANVRLSNVRKSFGAFEAIKGLDLEIKDKEFVVLVGPSGCGKSTLLRMIAGLESITSGELLIDGERMNDKPPDERELAMVFQSYALYPHMSVQENMSFALRLAGVSKQARHQKTLEAAKKLQLDHLLDRRPSELSGGQRQRVAIGRTIVRQPKVFLFDEPLSNLDAALRGQMRIELARLHQELEATMIYVTHDQVEAMTMADRIAIMREGKIEQVGTPLELYEEPATQFVAGFIGSPTMNFVNASMLSGAAAPHGYDKAATAGVRPEAMAIASEGPLAGEVKVLEHLGAETLVHVEVAGKLITLRSPDKNPAVVGEHIHLSVDPARLHWFDHDGNALANSRE